MSVRNNHTAFHETGRILWASVVRASERLKLRALFTRTIYSTGSSPRARVNLEHMRNEYVYMDPNNYLPPT